MTRIYTQKAASFEAPSVTTFLAAINKPALVNWAARVEREAVIEAAITLYKTLTERKEWLTDLAYEGSLQSFIGKSKEHAKRKAEAGEIGSEIHDLIDWDTRQRMSLKVQKGQPFARPEAVDAYKKWLRWANEVQFEPVFLEQPLWNKQHGYAGRMDFTANLTIEGVKDYYLGDYKSGKGIYIEAYLQVAAYREAIREMGHTVPDRAVIVRLPKQVTDPEPEMMILTAEQLDEHFQTFLAVQHLYRWMKRWDVWKKPVKPQVVELPENMGQPTDKPSGPLF